MGLMLTVGMNDGECGVDWGVVDVAFVLPLNIVWLSAVRRREREDKVE